MAPDDDLEEELRRRPTLRSWAAGRLNASNRRLASAPPPGPILPDSTVDRSGPRELSPRAVDRRSWTVAIAARPSASRPSSFRRARPPGRAGREALGGARTGHLGSFRLTERSGETVTEADLADEVWIAAFIFTRCPASCPRITAAMDGFQERTGRYRRPPGQHHRRPEHDTPEVLDAYARRFRADPDRWWFLTGPEAGRSTT